MIADDPGPIALDALRARQLAANASSRGQWDGFSGHRLRVTGLLLDGDPSGRLCVLGAGNANDLDLPALLDAYREVLLVDLDADALSSGADRQGVVDRPGLRILGGIDLTAMLDHLARWSPAASIAPAELSAMAEWPASRVPLALPGPFDRIASTCLLSQVVGSVYNALGPGHPQYFDAVRALRAGHLRLLSRLVGPGGRAVLITDVASSERVPIVATAPESSLAELIPRLRRDRDVITGLHPASLLAVLRDDPALAGRFSRIEPHPPWRWRLHARSLLVWAVSGHAGPRPPRIDQLRPGA